MLQAMIYSGKAFTALVWVLGIWAWTGFSGIGNDPSFFTQLMRMVFIATLIGHLLVVLGFYFWARKIKLATLGNLAKVLFFGMFQVAAIWLKRAEAEDNKP